jgi:3-deoxy-7-phosphoheptulonate synthase
VVVREIEEFQRIVPGAGGVAGGLHLEATPDPVTECLTNEAELPGIGERYTTLCDPRLNPQQALAAAGAWTAAGAPDRGEADDGRRRLMPT